MTESVFYVVPKDEEKQHVSKEMTPTTMEEDVGDDTVKVLSTQKLTWYDAILKQSELEERNTARDLPEENCYTG